MKICIDCAQWNQTGQEPHQGHCGLYSVACEMSKNKPRFLEKDMVKPIKIIRHVVSKIKGRLMSEEELAMAAQNRKIQRPLYPDMRELTDESKKVMRKRRKK